MDANDIRKEFETEYCKDCDPYQRCDDCTSDTPYSKHLESLVLSQAEQIEELNKIINERDGALNIFAEDEVELDKTIADLNKLYTESDLALQEYMLKDEKNQAIIEELKKENSKLNYNPCSDCWHSIALPSLPYEKQVQHYIDYNNIGSDSSGIINTIRMLNKVDGAMSTDRSFQSIKNIPYNSYINKNNINNDINLLKSLVKAKKFWELLNRNNNILSDSFVEGLFKSLVFYITLDSKYLLTSTNSYWSRHYGKMHKISGLIVLKKYGLSVIDECTEKCVVKLG